MGVGAVAVAVAGCEDSEGYNPMALAGEGVNDGGRFVYIFKYSLTFMTPSLLNEGQYRTL